MGASDSKPAHRGCLHFGKSSLFKNKIIIAILGLDNAGKTSTVLALAKEPADDLAPTVGFSSREINAYGSPVTLYDLGGGPKIRGIWKNYLAEVHGVVYVVDAADPSRVEEAAKEFTTLCQNQYISGKPILILANKSDKPEALSEYDLTEMMNLEEVVNMNMVPTKVQASTTMSKDHATLKEGMKWLYMAIATDYTDLCQRVNHDSTALKEKQSAERRERMARIKREREEREAAEEAANNSDNQTPGDNEDDEPTNHIDPFKSLGDHLNDKAKEKKQKTKPKEQKTDNLDENQTASSPTTAEGEDNLSTKDNTPSENDDLTAAAQVYNKDSSLTKPAGRAPSPRPAAFGDGLPSALPSRLPPLGGTLPPLSGTTPLRPLDSLTGEATTKKKKRKKKARISPGVATSDDINESNFTSEPSAGLLTVQEEDS